LTAIKYLVLEAQSGSSVVEVHRDLFALVIYQHSAQIQGGLKTGNHFTKTTRLSMKHEKPPPQVLTNMVEFPELDSIL
jgi:hypothetical protein